MQKVKSWWQRSRQIWQMTRQDQASRKVRRVPIERQRRSMKVGLWAIIIAVGLLVGVFLIRSAVTVQRTHQLTKENTAIKASLTSLKAANQRVSNVSVFGQQFIEAYYATNQDSNDYQEKVQKFLAQDLTPPDLGELTGTKNLKSVSVWSQKTSGKRTQLAYLVAYEYINKDNQDDKHDGQELIRFTVQKVGDHYSVVSQPYTQGVPNLATSKAKKIANNANLTREATTKQAAVQEWLAQTFLPRYINSNNVDDVKYMMKSPSQLGGVAQYDSIKDLKVYHDAKHKGQLQVKATVVTKDQTSGVKENIELSLRLANYGKGDYYVESLSHDLGGK